MIIRLIVILFSFSLLFSQEKKDKTKKKKKIFSNTQSTEDYLDVLEKSLDLLRTNYVDSINESELILSGIKGLLNPLDPYTKLLMEESKEIYECHHVIGQIKTLSGDARSNTKHYIPSAWWHFH